MNQHLDRITGCAPLIRTPVLRLIDQCEVKLKRKLLIVRGWASVQEQMLKFQQGRTYNRETELWEVTDKSLVVTAAKPGSSGHNVITRAGEPASVCVDLIPLNLDGTADWQVADHDPMFWEELWELAWKVGLDPLGDPIGSYLAGDLGHFEEAGYTWKLDGLGLMLPTNLLTTV